MKLPEPHERWTSEYQARVNRAVESELDRKRGVGDIELARSTVSGATRNERLILSSPNGTRYAIVVSDAGGLSTVAA
jgi:hypothetical protein